MFRYFFIDTETGGLKPESASLLQIAIAVTDQNFNIIDSTVLDTMPNDKVFMAHPRALEVNGIDLQKHVKTAYSYKQAAQRIYDFIIYHTNPEAISMWAGWNVQFDLNFFNHYIAPNSILGHRVLDVQTLFHFYTASIMQENYSMSLSKAAEYFGYSNEDLHHAMSDVRMTITIAKTIARIMTDIVDQSIL